MNKFDWLVFKTDLLRAGGLGLAAGSFVAGGYMLLRGIQIGIRGTTR